MNRHPALLKALLILGGAILLALACLLSGVLSRVNADGLAVTIRYINPPTHRIPGDAVPGIVAPGDISIAYRGVGIAWVDTLSLTWHGRIDSNAEIGIFAASPWHGRMMFSDTTRRTIRQLARYAATDTPIGIRWSHYEHIDTLRVPLRMRKTWEGIR